MSEHDLKDYKIDKILVILKSRNLVQDKINNKRS